MKFVYKDKMYNTGNMKILGDIEDKGRYNDYMAFSLSYTYHRQRFYYSKKDKLIVMIESVGFAKMKLKFSLKYPLFFKIKKEIIWEEKSGEVRNYGWNVFDELLEGEKEDLIEKLYGDGFKKIDEFDYIKIY